MLKIQTTNIKLSFCRSTIMKLPVKKSLLLFIALVFFSCKDETVPKPASQLRLDYPAPNYTVLNTNCPFSFEINTAAQLKNNSCSYEIQYPKMKATVYLTYKEVHNDIDKLLLDAQNLTYKLHTLKADDILEQPFVNPNKKVYGMFYKVGGNAATNALFYATDSTKHFMTGSVYFYAKPNYDSILPASQYVQDDMRRIMETMVWK
jgi:gliding motility-associated lipoprotein GldD